MQPQTIAIVIVLILFLTIFQAWVMTRKKGSSEFIGNNQLWSYEWSSPKITPSISSLNKPITPQQYAEYARLLQRLGLGGKS